MMRGDISATSQMVFAILLVLFVLTVVWNSVMVPAMTSYEKEHAILIAQSLATAVNSLSREDWGSFYKELGLAWDVRVFHEDGDAYISVSHEKVKSGDIMLIGDAEDFEGINVNSIYVIKEPGKKPRLQLGSSAGDMYAGGEHGGGGAARSTETGVD
jgi:hypothetical protein